MSFWLFPTTADAGMTVMAPNRAALFQEAAYGVQAYLISERSAKDLNQHVRHNGEWRVRSEHQPNDLAFLYLAWLDEIVYRSEVHGQWLVESHVIVKEDEHGLELVAQVSWVDANQVEREIEIKAVTTHELSIQHVEAGRAVSSRHDGVPEFVGPGWYAQVVFDI